MNIRKLIYMVAIVAAAISCDKEETTETLPSLEGTLTISGVQEFIHPGQTLTFAVEESVTHPEGGEVNYCWKVTPSMSR